MLMYFLNLNLCMTKLRGWVLCFLYFLDNLITSDFLILKKRNWISNLFEIFVMFVLFDLILKIFFWWELSNDNFMFSIYENWHCENQFNLK